MTLFRLEIQPSESASTDLQISVSSESGGFYKKSDAVVVLDANENVYYAQADIITIADAGETPPTAIPDGKATAKVTNKTDFQIYNNREYTFVAGVEQTARTNAETVDEFNYVPGRTADKTNKGDPYYHKITDTTQGKRQAGITNSKNPQA